MTLEREFDKAMFGIYRDALEQADYRATKFLQMLQRDGGVATAKSLINASRPSDGYTALYLKGRLDITVEALIFGNEKWHVLFTSDEIEQARKRLEKYEYFT